MNNSGLKNLEDILKYTFKDHENILHAIQHPGLRKRDKKFAHKFEKLEFLGDRVLGLALASILYEHFHKDTEGDLAVRIATLAGTDFLIELSKKTGIINCFKIPKDFFVSVNKTSSSIADMMEAVFASIYLDSDFMTAKRVVSELWTNDINKVIYKEKDPKSQLQEILQAKSKTLPTYRLLKISGEAHDPIFEIEVMADGDSAIGCGNSKKAAEHDAAMKLIQKIKE